MSQLREGGPLLSRCPAQPGSAPQQLAVPTVFLVSAVVSPARRKAREEQAFLGFTVYARPWERGLAHGESTLTTGMA